MGWILAALFLLLSVGNLSIAIGRCFRHKTGTLVPFIGGLAGMAAFFTLPFPTLRHWWWIPPVADIGTTYLITITAIFLIQRLFKREPRPPGAP